MYFLEQKNNIRWRFHNFFKHYRVLVSLVESWFFLLVLSQIESRTSVSKKNCQIKNTEQQFCIFQLPWLVLFPCNKVVLTLWRVFPLKWEEIWKLLLFRFRRFRFKKSSQIFFSKPIRLNWYQTVKYLELKRNIKNNFVTNS